jgi:hypothetical protein
MTDEDLLEIVAREVREERAEEASSGSTPLDAALRDRIVADALRALGPPVVVAPRRPWRRLAVAAAPLAMAAAVLLYLGAARTSPLPGYDAEWSAGALEQRSFDSVTPDVLALSPAGRFELVLRPRSAAGAVEVRAFLVQNGAAAPWAPPIDVSADGAVHVTGRVGSLFAGRAGNLLVAVAVGNRGAVPSDPSIIARHAIDGGGGEHGRWELFTHRVEVRAAP